uniref:SOS1/NGEF-like PH domain-containing protein n=1 Tax=Plectus sambesii TaxID=2011161 RepID=A0A914V8J4_9BILA
MEALEVMLSVPKRANDIIHLNMLDGFAELRDSGECLMQGTFTVWDAKQLIKKGRERQLFLFDLCVVFSKKQDTTDGKHKYVYKNRLMLSEINVTEHIEGDQCKFALWTGSVPNSEHRTIMKAVDHKAKL